jgi:hypothetical protein
MVGPRHRLAGQGGGVLRFDQEAADRRIAFFQKAGDASIGAAGAGKVQEHIQRAAALLPEFRAGCTIMRQPGTVAMKLVGPEGATLLRQALRRLLDQRQVSAGNLAGRRLRKLVHQHHFGAQRRHHARPLR